MADVPLEVKGIFPVSSDRNSIPRSPKTPPPITAIDRIVTALVTPAGVRADLYPSPLGSIQFGSMRFFVDAPVSWSKLGRLVTIRGWCFEENGRPVKAVRLVLPGFAVHGTAGLSRPDVKGAMPEAPDDLTGFEVRAVLPQGRTEIRLQVQSSDGLWADLLRTTVTQAQWRLPLWWAGGTLDELMAVQTPTRPVHVPRILTADRYPDLRQPVDRMPGLSIATPSFNQANFLETCLSSVLRDPTLKPDHVVQDGGSTDGSVEIIRRHADRLHAWESTPDHGQADAIARGFAKTRGQPDDLMAWLNSDDFYLPGALRFVAGYFARNPKVDVVYGHRIVVDEDSHEIGRWFLPRHDPEVLRLMDFVPQETLFWRRRIWDRVGGIDTTLQFALDWDLLLRFQAAGANIVRLPYFLGCFRVHARQKTAAAMQTVGQPEIDRLRQREQGRPIASAELETHPQMLRYLRRSARVALMWKFGLRV